MPAFATDIASHAAARAAERQKIGRYNMYDMWYRSSLEDHIQHLRLIAKSSLPHLKEYCLNEQLVFAYIDTHDDPEIYPKLGDVQAAYKAVMNPTERAELERLELEALEYVVERFGDIPLVGDFTYRTILLNYRRKYSPEAQLVNLWDKLSAFGEAMLELTAGNPDPTQHKPDPQGRMTKNPFEGYPVQTEKIINDSPFLSELRWRQDLNHYRFRFSAPGVAYKTILRQGKEHTLKEVKQYGRSDRNGIFNCWVRLILESDDQRLTEKLYVKNQQAFPNCRP